MLADSKPAEAHRRRRRRAARSCTARSARTAPCRGCSSSRTCPYVGAGVAALGALHGQVTCSRPVLRDRGIPVARERRRLRLGDDDREPVRLPGLRQAGAARLLGRDLEGARRGGARGRRSRSRSGTTRRCSSRSSSRASRSSAACSATADRADRVASSARSSRTHDEWYDYAAKYDDGRHGHRSCRPGFRTTTAARVRSSPSTRSSRPSARAWPASTSSCARTARCVVNELNTIPGFTATSVYAQPLRGVRDPVCGAPRPPDRSWRSTATNAASGLEY